MNNNDNCTKFMRIYCILSIPILLFSSCVKEVKNLKNLPSSVPKLVVGCFISPQDTVLAAQLSRSKPLYVANTNTAQITDASVRLSDGAKSVTLVYSAITKKYELKASLFPIKAGQSYSLTVTTPQGEKVSASCIVPVSNITAALYDNIDSASYRIKWNDIAGEVNYYRVYSTVVFPQNVVEASNINNDLQSDLQKDGKELLAVVHTNNVFSAGNVIGYDNYILNIDYNYYRYQYSLDHYSGNDPFSEPSLIYTNINGGLGVFAAYQLFYHRKKP
jgi:hypothetical protein